MKLPITTILEMTRPKNFKSQEVSWKEDIDVAFNQLRPTHVLVFDKCKLHILPQVEFLGILVSDAILGTKGKSLHNTSFFPQFHWKKCLSLLCLAWWIVNFDRSSCLELQINFSPKSLIKSCWDTIDNSILTLTVMAMDMNRMRVVSIKWDVGCKTRNLILWSYIYGTCDGQASIYMFLRLINKRKDRHKLM